jgi:hypothetical protein
MAKKLSKRQEHSQLRTLVLTEESTTTVITDDRTITISNGIAHQASINDYDDAVKGLLYLVREKTKRTGYECRIRSL